MTRAAVSRGALFFGFWLVLLPSAKPVDLVVGAFAAAVATWVSLRLLPPASGRVRFGALLARLPRFLWQSVLAGIDVARRAFDPRLPLKPGFVTYPTGLPRGFARNAFASVTSLLPGTVPVADDETGITYHCLDTGQPVLEQLQAAEREYANVFVPGRPHG
ncbi:MAG: Na+/H+ antiporter subunit E [Burkholderiales bacterium]